jgi:predicted phosphoribosyltransferase
MFASDILFQNREDAATQLVAKLKKYKNQNALVLGIPRGGVEIGYYIAEQLNAALSIVISKKLPHPLHPEFAIGAICEEGTLYLNNEFRVSEDWLSRTVQELKQEIHRRVQLYRGGQPVPEMKGRVVILADDGIATGATLASAMVLCRNHEAAKIIVAVPVAGEEFVEEIYNADELIILHQPHSFHGVGNVYDDFSQLNDEDVLSFLKRAEGNTSRGD